MQPRLVVDGMSLILETGNTRGKIGQHVILLSEGVIGGHALLLTATSTAVRRRGGVGGGKEIGRRPPARGGIDLTSQTFHQRASPTNFGGGDGGRPIPLHGTEVGGEPVQTGSDGGDLMSPGRTG